MFWVDNAWVILALPLAALVIILAITRPLELAARPKGAKPLPAAGGHGGHAPAVEHPGLDESHTAHGSDQAVPAREEEHGGGGHGGHGGKTPFWGSVGSGIGTLAMLVAFLWAVLVFIQFLNGTVPAAGRNVNFSYNWFAFGPQQYIISFRVDTLTAVMLVVVTGVSMLVNLYSTGYMAGDPGYSRFFIELALFTASMLILVLGANLLVLFIGWELVGLSSYLLIGFWFDQAPPADPDLPYPPPAALKAFVTTRLGDFGMLIGLLILWTTTGTFDFVALNNPHNGAYSTVSQATITLAMILIFCGAVGKSAQFPLHVWLPDAMAGPTPVSALIHAATMVAAGVYLVARLFPLYHSIAGPQSLEVVGYVGGFTALFAASIALTQNDIKKVLAYSTISQLGYMFVGLAVGPNSSLGIFHLFTHAFFKALLFLGSGSVIHAIADQDMRKMGGLAKFMPITALMFLIATLSISGIPPFSGFWSKDAIIGATQEYGATHGGNYTLYAMTLFTAGLTAFYMFRLYFLTFGGRGSAGAGFWGGQRQYRGEAHPHESPWTMWVPLALLAIPTVFAGFWSLGNSFANFYTGQNLSYANPFLDGLTYLGIAVAVAGILLAWLIYGLGVVPATFLMRNPVGRAAYNVLLHKYYLDELYGWIIRYIVLGLARFAAGFDRVVIDGIVNGSATSVRRIGDATRRSETGVLQNYGVVFFGGALVIVLILFFVTGTIGR